MAKDIVTAPDGSAVWQVTLRGDGLTAQLLTWGATVQGLWLDGLGRSLILGSPDVRAYFGALRYFGAVVGPVANRIAGAQFDLDARRYQLEANERGRTTLHGGACGTGQSNWKISDLGASHCRLTLWQPDGLHGFPGPLDIAVTYSLANGALRVEVTAESGAQAVFAPAFHGYWNLDGTGDLSGHQLTVAADSYLAVDADLIPDGAPASVAGTVFDFRHPSAIDRAIDHNLCLAPTRRALTPVATLTAGDLSLDIATTEPGLQVYACGGTSSGEWAGHGGKPFGPYAGVALEPQVWPNAVNRPDFPSARIAPGLPVTQVSTFTLRR